MSKRHASPHVGRRSFLKAATLAGAGSLAPSVAADAQGVAQSPPRSAPMVDELTAEELRSLLKLEPNQTCGTSTPQAITTACIVKLR
ncbi:MAG TPA: hypothetical protein VFB63_04910 [Bryobacteraceae bacterium]|nr:hypothetical protein [Bryobacteraceae bacterium]